MVGCSVRLEICYNYGFTDMMLTFYKDPAMENGYYNTWRMYGSLFLPRKLDEMKDMND